MEKIIQLIPAIPGWEIIIQTKSHTDGVIDEYEISSPVLAWALVAEWDNSCECFNEETEDERIISPVFMDENLGIVTEKEFLADANKSTFYVSVNTKLLFNGKPATSEVLKKDYPATDSDYRILAAKVCAHNRKNLSPEELSKRNDIPVNFIIEAIEKRKKA
jgi:hypothetical protein